MFFVWRISYSRPILLLSIAAAVVCGCSEDPEKVFEQPVAADITFVTSIGGPGDNGYNDNMLAGVIGFAQTHGLELSVVRPSSVDEAAAAIRSWREAECAQRRALLLGGNDYDGIIADCLAELDTTRQWALIVDGETGYELPEGVSGLCVARYGVCYLAGCMAQDSPSAHIVMACPGNAIIEEAATAFADGYKAPAPKGIIERHYLAQDFSGFTTPDSAYRLAAQLDETLSSKFVFPLAGGSAAGLFKYSRDKELTLLLIAGMDVDCTYHSPKVPFSVVLRIDQAVRDWLEAWRSRRVASGRETLGLESGITQIVCNTRFYDYNCIWEDYYLDDDYWTHMLEKHLGEAIEKERENAASASRAFPRRHP